MPAKRYHQAVEDDHELIFFAFQYLLVSVLYILSKPRNSTSDLGKTQNLRPAPEFFGPDFSSVKLTI